MKKIVSLIAGFIFCMRLMAQQTDPPTDSSIQWDKDYFEFVDVNNNKTNNATFKTDALNSRLIGYTYYSRMGGALVEQDSTVISYSGTRGGDYNNISAMQSDMSSKYVWTAGSWEGNYRTVSTYNASNQLIGVISLNWVAGTWENDSKSTNNYDINGNRLETIIEIWTTGTWALLSKSEYTYDANNNRTTSTYYKYTGGIWVEETRLAYSYDANSNQLSKSYYTWSAGAWRLESRYTYTYDMNNNQLTELYGTYIAGTWTPEKRKTRTFNTTNKTTLEIVENYSAGTWTNAERYTSQYDANNNQTIYQKETWVSGGWKNYERTVYQYDVNNNIIQKVRYRWLSSNVWEETDQYFYTYNSFYQYTSTLYQEYSGVWESYRSDFYYYESYQDGVGISESSIKASDVYPNPFTKNTLIDFTTKKDGELTFTVSDINGKVLYTKNNYYPAGTNSILFDGTNLSRGIYIYTLSGQSGFAKGRLIKQ